MTATTLTPQASAPIAVPCPPWCQEEPGHAYDILHNTDGAEGRFHCAYFGDRKSGDFVILSAAAFWRDGAGHLERPGAHLWLGGNAHPDEFLTAKHIRSVIGALSDSAAVMELLEVRS